MSNNLKMRRGEFIALSACTMALTALGIDIMLPVFASLREHFNLSHESTAAAHIITFFFLGQVAQLLFGVLSDRFGRRAILRIGFPLYIIGGVIAAFAPTLGLMYAARFVAGMGASAVLTTTVAGVRDRFVGDEMARIMSLVFTIFLFTPILAPFLGLAILSVSSWQMVFLTPPLFAVVVYLWSLRLEESLPPEKRITLKWTTVTASIREVLSSLTFVRYTAVTTVLFAGLSSYVASSERMIGEIYGRPELFAWIFAGIGLIMSLCALINSRLSSRFGARRTLRWLLICYTIIAAALVVFTITSDGLPDVLIFFLGIATLMAINIAVEPNSSALALEPMGKIAGIAAAVYGTVFFFVGASLGSVISYLMVSSVTPLAVAFLIIGILTLVFAFAERR